MRGSVISALFEKTGIKSLELKNRLVRSATHEGMCDPDGFITQALFKLYERLAKKMMAEMGFDGIEVSCGIMGDGNPMARGNLPLDVFVAGFLHFFK